MLRITRVHGRNTAPTLRLEGSDVWTTPRVTGALCAGVVVHFP